MSREKRRPKNAQDAVQELLVWPLQLVVLEYSGSASLYCLVDGGQCGPQMLVGWAWSRASLSSVHPMSTEYGSPRYLPDPPRAGMRARTSGGVRVSVGRRAGDHSKSEASRLPVNTTCRDDRSKTKSYQVA